MPLLCLSILILRYLQGFTIKQVTNYALNNRLLWIFWVVNIH